MVGRVAHGTCDLGAIAMLKLSCLIIGRAPLEIKASLWATPDPEHLGLTHGFERYEEVRVRYLGFDGVFTVCQMRSVLDTGKVPNHQLGIPEVGVSTIDQRGTVVGPSTGASGQDSGLLAWLGVGPNHSNPFDTSPIANIRWLFASILRKFMNRAASRHFMELIRPLSLVAAGSRSHCHK